MYICIYNARNTNNYNRMIAVFLIEMNDKKTEKNCIISLSTDDEHRLLDTSSC